VRADNGPSRWAGRLGQPNAHCGTEGNTIHRPGRCLYSGSVRAVCVIAGAILGVIAAFVLVFLISALLDLVGANIDVIALIWILILLAIPAGAVTGAVGGWRLGTRLTNAKREREARVTRHWGERR